MLVGSVGSVLFTLHYDSIRKCDDSSVRWQWVLCVWVCVFLLLLLSGFGTERGLNV